MAKDSPAVTDAELAVLELAWELESATKRQIVEKLYPKCTVSDQATVQKLLERLEAKGYIERDRSSFAHVVRAAVTRAAFAGSQLKAVADKLSEGSLVPLLAHLVETKQLSAREREAIRQLLEDSKR